MSIRKYTIEMTIPDAGMPSFTIRDTSTAPPQWVSVRGQALRDWNGALA